MLRACIHFVCFAIANDFLVQAQAMQRCRGITRAGKPCSIAADCNLRDEKGRLVAEPLKLGGNYCIFHAKPFCSKPAAVGDRRVLLVYIDLETTGVDLARDRIVELAATQDICHGSNFSTLIHVEESVLTARESGASSVHGIEREEILAAPDFVVAWGMFLHWLEMISNNAIEDASDSEGDVPAQPQPCDKEIVILLAAHNGIKFDFPFLLIECRRHGISWMPFETFLFVDTYVCMQHIAQGCLKLQCLVHSSNMTHNFQAHRALDDCMALRSVVNFTAARLGLSSMKLLLLVAVECDAQDSAVQISVLAEDAARNSSGA